MKILVVVAPLASAWLEPNGLLEFFRETEPRLTEERKEEQVETSPAADLSRIGKYTTNLPAPTK